MQDFSVTIQNVQEQSHDLWRYQRFLIVKEFSEKPSLPPPFNVIYYIFILIRYPCIRVRSTRRQPRSSKSHYLFGSETLFIDVFLATTEMLLGDVKTNTNSVQQTQVKGKGGSFL